VIDSRCFPLSGIIRQPYRLSYKIPREQFSYIFVPYRYQIYYLKNKEANKIVIDLRMRFTFSSRVTHYQRALIKDDSLIPIECDGKLSDFGRLKKK
jgi:hypothetical protein